METLQSIPLLGPLVPFLPWLAALAVAWFAWNALARSVSLPRLTLDDLAARFLGEDYRKKQTLKQAEQLRKAGNFLAAGQTYEEAGELAKAAEVYLEGEEYVAAGFAFEKLPGRAEKAAECFVKGGDYKKAAEIYTASGKAAKAAAIFEEKGNNLDAAGLYAQGQVWDKAASLYLKGGYPLKAADCFEKLGEFRKAAECLERNFMENVSFSSTYTGGVSGEARQAQRAGKLYAQAGDLEKAREIYLKGFFFRDAAEASLALGQFTRAAEYFLRAEDLAAAADAFEKGGDAVKAALYRGEIAFKAGRTLEAASFFQQGEDYARAAELFEQAGALEQAGGAYEAGESWLAAAGVYARAGKTERAAACYEKGGDAEMAARLFEESGQGARAAELYERAGQTFKSGLTAAGAGQVEKAIALLQRVAPGDEHFAEATERLAALFLETGRHALAIERLQKVLGGRAPGAETLHLHYWLARAHEAAGDRSRALEGYGKVLAEDLGYRDVEARVGALRSAVAAGAGAAPAHPPAAAATGQPPTTVGKYRIVERLGQGAMGVVYLAHDTVLDRPVALKLMAPTIAASPVAKERFEREARIVARLRHPNIVTVHDLGYHTDGSPYIVMERLSGQDLLSALKARPRISMARGIAVLADVLAGLGHAHAQGIIHRDIKPANVFLEPGGGVKIMDFGVARLSDQAPITESGVLVGTADYMSPEQVKGASVDSRSDLFGVGCLLFELVRGRRAFMADTLPSVLYRVLNEAPDLGSLAPTEPQASLRRILEKALAKSPAERYATAADFERDLRELLARLPAETPPGPAPTAAAASPSPVASAAPAPAPVPPAAGAAAAERFALREELARGPLGVVHRGDDVAKGTSVTLRLLPPEAAPHLPALVKDLEAAARVQHAHLVRVLGLVPLSGRRCVVTQFVKGKSLAGSLPPGQRLPLSQAQTIARGLAQALAAVHAQGLAHGGVQPSNILSAAGVLKVTDLGLGRLRLALAPATPYRAPEGRLDARADVYSFGAVLYQLVSGHPPAVGSEGVPPLRSVAPDAPPELDALVMRCLSADPAARFASGAELMAALGVKG